MRTKILRTAFDILWRSVVFGLGAMLILALLVRLTGPFNTEDYAVPTMVELATEDWAVDHITPFYFPIFPAFYSADVPLETLLLQQCLGFILAAAGAVVAIYINRVTLFGIVTKLLLTALIMPLAFTPLFELFHFRESKLHIWFLPTALIVISCAFALLRYSKLLHKKQGLKQIEDTVQEKMELRDQNRYLEKRPMVKKVTEAGHYRDFVRMEISLIRTALTFLLWFTCIAYPVALLCSHPL